MCWKLMILTILTILTIRTGSVALDTPIKNNQCIFGFHELGCNMTNVKVTDLTVTETQKNWNLGLWFAALFGKEMLVYGLMSENSLFSLHLCNKAVSDFFVLFYKQFGRMIGIGGLMGFTKFLSISHNALLRKQETQKLLQSYLTSHRFYDAIFNSDINDTDHRVSTDVLGMVDSKINIMNKGLMLPFLIIYYTYTVWKEMTLLGLLGIYGFFVLSAVIIRLLMVPVYTVLQEKEEAEAEYRISHALVINNGEQIAFGNGEQHEYDQLSHLFNQILYKQKYLSFKQGYLEAATSFFANFGGILTYLILSLSFFAGQYDSLSGPEKAAIISRNAFFAMYLISCLTNVIELSDEYAKYLSHKTRIQKLSNYLAKHVQISDSNIQNVTLKQNVLLSVRNLTITTPEKKALVSNLSFDVIKGKHCLITGSNGSGKTSFARVLSNLWLPSNGSIIMTTNISPRPTSMFLPQKPFLASGSLLDIVTYPFWYSSLNDLQQESARHLLKFVQTRVNFTSLEPYFDDPVREYSSSQYSQLSSGEMQKLSFLQILFWKPLIAVLDESTSSMDRDSAKKLYDIVDMFDITMISISHQDYLKPWHSQFIDLDDYPSPEKLWNGQRAISHIAGLLLDKNKSLELVILFGGRKGNVSSDCWALNCLTKCWRPLDILAQPSVSSAYTCDAMKNNRIFIFGGMVKESDEFCASNRLLEYNHEEESIKVLEPGGNGFTPPPLISATMIYRQGCLYLFGGMDHDGYASNRLYKYDVSISTWSLLNALNPPAGRFGNSLNFWVRKSPHGDIKENFLVIYGGCLGKEMNMQNSGDVILYSLDHGEWCYPRWGNTPEIGRTKHTAFITQNSKLVIFGGVYSAKQAVDKFSDLIPSNTVLQIKFGTDYCRLDHHFTAKVVPRAAHSLSIKFRSMQGIIFGGYTNTEGYSPDLSEILVVDFGPPPVIPVRLEKNYIRWDDPFNLLGDHHYDLNIIDHETNSKRLVYQGKDNFWLINDLKESNRYTAFVIVSNSIGSITLDQKLLYFPFTYHDFILPPQNLKGKLEGTNILLDWKSSQNHRSYVLCYRIIAASSNAWGTRQKDKSHQKDKTSWLETFVGPCCEIVQPVTFFIGEVSSSDVAREIEFHVKAVGAADRSKASDSFTLNLQDYWRNLILSKPPISSIETEEVMIEGESNPTMITGEDDVEELEVGETIRPQSAYLKEKSKPPVLEKKSSKIKIRRDFGVDQKDPEVPKVHPLHKQERDSDMDNFLTKRKDALDSAMIGLPKRKLEQVISESTHKDHSGLESAGNLPDSKQIKNKNDADDFFPRKKLVLKSNSTSALKKSSFAKQEISFERNNLKSDNINDSEEKLYPRTFKDSPRKDDPIINSHPVSQRLQLKMIERQIEIDLPRSPRKEAGNEHHDSHSVNQKNKDMLSDRDILDTKNETYAFEQQIKEEQIIENDALVPKNVPTINSVEKARKMFMDPSKPMYYNLKYGADIQVFYDEEWWIAKALFYAYDEKFQLFLKIHFPAWNKSDDLYVPLIYGDSVIRDASKPVPKRFPVYKGTQYKFDLSSTTSNGHHGVHSSEIAEVLENGYLLKPMEKNPRFLDDD